MKLFKTKPPVLPKYDIPDVGQLIKAVHGDVDPDKISLFIPVKNEMGLIPAFLGYYRSIGYEQFLFFDDQSDDGTFEYLTAQDDCIVIHTTMTFGEELEYTGPTHKNQRETRFGTFSKMAIPHHFLPGKIVGYYDADEFLLLPPGVSHISEVHDRIDALESTGLYATVVEFFPRSTESFKKPLPSTFEGLMEEYGWFEAEDLFDPMAPLDKKGKPVFHTPSKSMRLFEDYKIDPIIERNTLREKIYLSSKEKRDQGFNRSARHKTPILRRTDESFMFSCHDAIVPPSGEILLTLAHFVFTSNFAQKIENARKWKAHVKGAAKYNYYRRLLDAMDGVEDGFLTERSQKYENPQQLIDCGLMKW
ncbi:glycosyltransferase family 2 protein [Primorskyibacter sp. S187A]|uniref:glycosyltransferase family 2 protein n=1 Tax=Primorskyibacter sp. S187A TaxID=3415130 RepID=UPI003C7A5B47